jgi:hypothetical protein
MDGMLEQLLREDERYARFSALQHRCLFHTCVRHPCARARRRRREDVGGAAAVAGVPDGLQQLELARMTSHFPGTLSSCTPRARTRLAEQLSARAEFTSQLDDYEQDVESVFLPPSSDILPAFSRVSRSACARHQPACANAHRAQTTTLVGFYRTADDHLEFTPLGQSTLPARDRARLSEQFAAEVSAGRRMGIPHARSGAWHGSLLEARSLSCGQITPASTSSRRVCSWRATRSGAAGSCCEGTTFCV